MASRLTLSANPLGEERPEPLPIDRLPTEAEAMYRDMGQVVMAMRHMLEEALRRIEALERRQAEGEE